jgi:hypothetical protein
MQQQRQVVTFCRGTEQQFRHRLILLRLLHVRIFANNGRTWFRRWRRSRGNRGIYDMDVSSHYSRKPEDAVEKQKTVYAFNFQMSDLVHWRQLQLLRPTRGRKERVSDHDCSHQQTRSVRGLLAIVDKQRLKWCGKLGIGHGSKRHPPPEIIA